MYRAAALLNFIEEANVCVDGVLDELESSGIAVPNVVTELYLEGLSLAEKATSLASEGNFSGASSTAIEALQKLKGTLRIVSEILPKTPSEAEVIAETIISLKVAVNRTYEYAKRLEELASKAQTTGYNTTNLKNLIRSVKVHLEYAFNELDGLDIEGSSRELAIARSLLNQSFVLYNELRDEVKTVKTYTFLTDTETRFTALKVNVTALSQSLTAQEKNATLTALNEAQYSLQNARVFIDEALIDETIKELVEYKEKVNESLKYIQAVDEGLGENN
jgi:hypothetical protein